MEDTAIDTWFERDRKHVCLSRRTPDGDAGPTIVEWWDGAVDEAVEDGFLEVGDYHGSAFAYARDNGLLRPGAERLTLKEAPKGIVASSEGKGVYLGWRTGGAPIWSTEATDEEMSRGAYAFVGEDDARALFDAEADAPDDVSFFEVGLDVSSVPGSVPSRASLDACSAAGVPLRDASPRP